MSDTNDKIRIVQETVAGKEITFAHVIGGPAPIIYQKLGLNPAIDYGAAAIGIMNMTPPESAVIAADDQLHHHPDRYSILSVIQNHRHLLRRTCRHYGRLRRHRKRHGIESIKFSYIGDSKCTVRIIVGT